MQIGALVYGFTTSLRDYDQSLRALNPVDFFLWMFLVWWPRSNILRGQQKKVIMGRVDQMSTFMLFSSWIFPNPTR